MTRIITRMPKLTKLKSMLKRLPSLAPRPASPATDTCRSPAGLHPVYVGKSRRRYLISAELAGHPLLQVLLQRPAAANGGGDDDSDGSGSTAAADVVGCEVVLFEHLLWMLENGEGENVEAVDELVEYYKC